LDPLPDSSLAGAGARPDHPISRHKENIVAVGDFALTILDPTLSTEEFSYEQKLRYHPSFWRAPAQHRC